MKIYGLGCSTEKLSCCIISSIDVLDESHQPQFIFVHSWLPKSLIVIFLLLLLLNAICVCVYKLSVYDHFGFKMVSLDLTANRHKLPC